MIGRVRKHEHKPNSVSKSEVDFNSNTSLTWSPILWVQLKIKSSWTRNQNVTWTKTRTPIITSTWTPTLTPKQSLTSLRPRIRHKHEISIKLKLCDIWGLFHITSTLNLDFNSTLTQSSTLRPTLTLNKL